VQKKVVIDTNVYISAIFWGGKPRSVVDMGRDKQIMIFASSEIEEEISERLKEKFKLPEDEVNQILFDFSSFISPVKVTRKYLVIPEDPDDNKFIECAMECGVDYIISGDKHLLNLKEYSGTKIVNASKFLSIFNRFQDVESK
jgi:putative PIN family toxin of toxin-antitoxin system